MSKKVKQPSPEDVAAQTGAQQQANLLAAIQGAQLSMLGEVSPFGEISFQQTGEVGGVPQFQRTTALSPLAQQQFEQQQQLGVGLLGLGQQQIPGLGGAFAPLDPGAFGGERAAIEEAAFNRALGLINPQFQRDIESFGVTAAERGLPIGSQARERLLDPILEQRRVTLESLAQQAIGRGAAEQQRLFQQQAFAQQFPLQQLSGLLGLVPGIQTPTGQAVGFQGIQAPNIQAAIQQLGQQQAQARGGLFGGIGQLFGTAAGGLLGGPFGAAAGSRLFGT